MIFAFSDALDSVIRVFSFRLAPQALGLRPSAPTQGYTAFCGKAETNGRVSASTPSTLASVRQTDPRTGRQTAGRN